MSIQGEIDRINNNIQTALNTVSAAGVTVSENANSDELPNAVLSLSNQKQDKLTGTAGQVVGFDENGNPVAQDAPASGVEMELLWENASPTSSFAAQTINLDCSQYNLFLFLYKSYKGSDKWFSVIGTSGHECAFNISSYEGNNIYIYWRTVKINDSKIVFENSSRNSIYESESLHAIPLRIYGIKGVS